MDIFDATQWREFEREQWCEAVRDRGLELSSLDVDERSLVFDAITSDLERSKREREAAETPTIHPSLTDCP
jgi:predicted kinase